MLDLTLGDPGGAFAFFIFMCVIGVVLGGVIFVVVAFPWARRPRYRNFGAMPRTGAACGAGIALFLAAVAWNTAFAEFYRVEVVDEAVRLHYHAPRRTPVIPLGELSGMRRGMTLDKLRAWRIELHTDHGTFYSTNMGLRQMEAAWAALAPFVKPLA